MKKRIAGLLLALVLMLIPALSYAELDYETIKTPHIIVIDAGDAEAAHPIYEREADAQLFPASTTKILTAIIALENKSLDDEITVGSEIRGLYELKNGYTPASSLMGLVEGETVTLRDLLHGLLLMSGNEAADAIAVGVAGSIDAFVEMMNAKAQELGMTNSHFKNPNGVQNKEHYATARDMAKLTVYALNNPDFAKIVSTATYEVPANSVRNYPLTLVNSNFLITAEGNPDRANLVYDKAIGVKTGLTTKSGSCLVAAAESDGAKAIVCLYEDDVDDKYDRFINAKAILSDLFENVYTSVSGDELNLTTHFACKIDNAREGDLNENGELEMDTDVSGIRISTLPEQAEALKNDPSAIKAEVKWENSLSAPVYQGQLLGTVNYVYSGRTIYSAELTAPSEVLEVALINAESFTAEDGAAVPSNGLLTTELPAASETAAVTAADGAAKASGLPGFVKYILIGIGALIVLFALIIAILLVRKSIRKKRRREMLRKKRLAEQRAKNAAMRTRTIPQNGQAAHRSSSRDTDYRRR